VAPEARSWAALGGRESVAARVSSGGWRWGMELTAGARLTETWERRPARKARTKREDVFPMKTRPTRGLDGPAGTVSAEWAARSAEPKSRKRISELKIRFLNLPRLWKFVE
jgi:hypothetical protein